MQHFNLKIGDKLSRRKDAFFKHYGIYVGFHNGQHLVAENNAPRGVRYVTYAQFLNGNVLESIERFKGNKYQRNQVIPFINSKLGTNYDLLTYNCEHFANEVQTGKTQSQQVQTAVGIGIIATLIWAGSSSNDC
jgi:hypothetical protein